MVKTIKLSSSGGIEWEYGPNGRRINTVGEPNEPLNQEECEQSVRIRLLTQKGSRTFHSDEGFDAAGVIGQYIEKTGKNMTPENFIKFGIIEALNQDPRVEGPDYLYVEQGLNRTYNVSVRAKLISGDPIEYNNRAGDTKFESGV